MKFIVFKEDNKKENKLFIFFLKYDSNENMIDKLNEIIDSADFSEMEGDYSTFEINTSKKVSEESVKDLLNIKIGDYYTVSFSECRDFFHFPYDEFEGLSDTEKAKKLNELFYDCKIRNYFDKEFKISIKALEDLKYILDAWIDDNRSQNDIYNLTINWINNYKDDFSGKLKQMVCDIKTTIDDNDDTFDNLKKIIEKKLIQLSMMAIIFVGKSLC